MRTLLLLLLGAFCLMLTACGGGTIGSGLGVSGTPISTSYGDHSTTGFSTFRITGRIISAQGKAMPFARIKAISNSGEVSTEANRLGQFNLDLKVSSGEMVTFQITYGKASWSLATDLSPAGRNIVPVDFKVFNQGRMDVIWLD